jgi:hypothetical protein
MRIPPQPPPEAPAAADQAPAVTGGAGRAEFLPERSTSRSRGLAFAAFAAVSDRFFPQPTARGGLVGVNHHLADKRIGVRTPARATGVLGGPFGLGAWTGCSGGRWCLPGWPFRVLRALHLRPA